MLAGQFNETIRRLLPQPHSTAWRSKDKGFRRRAAQALRGASGTALLPAREAKPLRLNAFTRDGALLPKCCPCNDPRSSLIERLLCKRVQLQSRGEKNMNIRIAEPEHIIFRHDQNTNGLTLAPNGPF